MSPADSVDPIPSKDHYSYTAYADPAMARSFDSKRFSGPIGEMIAGTQARVLANFVGRIHDRPILDVGTGTGRAALLFSRGGAIVTAIDASEEMLAIARKRAAEQGAAIKFMVGDVHALDFPDRSFDVAVALRVLMHSPKWRLGINELCRVADRLVIIDYPSRSSIALFQSLWRRMIHRLGVKTEPYRVFSHAQIVDALGRAGFRVRSVHRQFVLPIAFHKLLRSRRMTVRIEHFLDLTGLLKLFGSPVTLVAERCVIS